MIDMANYKFIGPNYQQYFRFIIVFIAFIRTVTYDLHNK